MILRHLIQKLEYIGRQFSTADIPVVDEKEEDVDFDIDIIQDEDGNYRVQMTRIWVAEDESRYAAILDAAQKAVGKTIEPGRNHDDVIIRYLVSYQMFHEGFTTRQIGEFLGRDHSSITHGVKYIEGALETPAADMDTFRKYNAFIEHLNEAE